MKVPVMFLAEQLITIRKLRTKWNFKQTRSLSAFNKNAFQVIFSISQNDMKRL